MKLRNILGGTLAIASAIAFTTPAVMADEVEPVKLGVVLSLSGPAAPFGIPERTAAEVAAKKINDEGGINGRPLELVIVDDKTDPTEAARVTQRLISSEKVVAIVGASTGSGTLALAPVAARNEVPVLAPNGTIGVTDKKAKFFPWVFRTSISDEVTIPALVDRAVASGQTRLAVFYQEDALGRFGMELLKKMAADSDRIEIVATAAVPLDATDITAQVTRIADSNPDAVILPLTSVGVGGYFLRTAHEIGLDVPVYGPLGTAQYKILDLAGEDALKNFVVSNMIDPSNLSPAQQELYDMIRAAGAEPAGGFTDLFGANSVMLAADAMKMATEITGKAIRDALESGEELAAWAATPYVYTKDNHDGLTADAIVWTKVENNRFTAAD